MEGDTMTDLFDDGMDWIELAMAMGLADEIARDRCRQRQLIETDEPIVPDEGDLEWFEKD